MKFKLTNPFTSIATLMICMLLCIQPAAALAPPPCENPAEGGSIAGSQSGCGPFDPQLIQSLTLPSGGTGTLEYLWQQSIISDNAGFTDIPSGNAPEYDPGTVGQTTWFRRLARVDCAADWNTAAISNVVEMTVHLPGIATITGPASVCAGTDPVQYITEAGMSDYAWNGLSGINNALNFDGSDDYVQSPVFGGIRTVELWFNADVQAQMPLFSATNNYSTNRTFDVHLSAPGMAGGSGNSFNTEYGISVVFFANDVLVPYDAVKSGWHHLAICWDGANSLEIYIDGNKPQGYVWDGGSWSASAQSQPFMLPSTPDPAYTDFWTGRTRSSFWGIGSQYFDGTIDEVRIWNIVRSESQILQSMNTLLNGTETGLIANYNFNQGIAAGNNTVPPVNILDDISPAGQDGNLMNFTLNGSVSNWVTGFPALILSNETSFFWQLPGTYQLSVSYTDLNGCPVISAPFDVEVNPVPVLSVSPSMPAITTCGGSVGLTASASQDNDPAYCLLFNGTDSYAEVNEFSLPQGNTSRTMEAWIRTTQSDNGTIMNWGNTAANQRSGLLVVSGRLYYVGEFNDLMGSTAINDGQWHHVAASYDGSMMTLYIDGVPDASSGMPAFNTSGTTLRIGRRALPDNGEYFNGRIEEVRIWDYARSQAEIQADLASFINPATPGLLCYYKFNEGSGSTSVNSSGGAAASLINSPAWVVSDVPLTPVINPDPLNYTYSWAPAGILSATAGSMVTASPSTSSMVYVTVTSSTGCSKEDSIFVYVSPLPVGVSEPVSVTDCQDSATLSVNGAGSCLLFNESSSMHVSTGIQPASEVTFECWINPHVLNDRWHVIANNDGWLVGDVHFQIAPNNLLEFSLGGSPDKFCTYVFTEGQWVHVAAVYSSISQTVLFYVDGNLINTETYPAPNTIAGGRPYSIGSWNGSDRFFNGKIDELRIWNTARSQSDIQNNMYTSVSPASPGLMAYFRFDEQSGSTSFDLVTGIPANLNNNPQWVSSAAPLQADPAITYTWSPSAGLGASTGATVKSSPAATTTYTVTGTALNGCTGSATTTVVVPQKAIGPGIRQTICEGTSASLYVNGAGNSLRFDGTNRYLETTNPALPQGNSPRTMEAWIKTTSTYASIINYGTNANSQRFGISMVGNLYFVSNSNDLSGTTFIADGQWHHVAVVFDGTTLSMYVDGVLDASSAKTLNTTGNVLRISKRVYPTDGEYYNGSIDEVRIWNTALSQAQIQAGMNSTADPLTPGLVCYFRMDEGIGDFTTDAVSGKPASLFNSPQWEKSLASIGGDPSVTYLWSPPDGLNTTTGSSVTASPLSDILYTITATGTDGCSTSDTIGVSVLPKPAVTAGSVQNTWCGPAAQLQATFAGSLLASSTTICIYDVPGGTPCDFQEICADGYASESAPRTSDPFSIAPLDSIASIDFNIYWASCQAGEWTFLLNGNLIGTSGILNLGTCYCQTLNPVSYPSRISIAGSLVMPYWNHNGPNTLTVVPSYGIFAVAGYTADIHYYTPPLVWSPAGKLDNPFSFNPLITVPGTETFTVTGTDANGCVSSSSVTVTFSQFLPESVTVGTGGDYPNLTGTGGLFETLNASVFCQNIEARIISDLTEPGTIALNQWTEDGNGPYTLTIVPDQAVLRNITGNVALDLIRFNGADRVTINGNYMGSGRYLLFRNAASYNATFTFTNDASHNTITNCIIEGSNRTTTGGVVVIGEGSSTGNDHNRFTANIFRNGHPTILPNNLLTSRSLSTVVNSNITIGENEFKNFRSSGILVSGNGSCLNFTVRNNSFYTDVASPHNTAQSVISFTPAASSTNNSITGNIIGGSDALGGGSAWVNSSSATFRAIQATGGTYAIGNNIIRNIRLSSTAAAAFHGIELTVVSGGQSTITNNTIGDATAPASIVLAGTGSFNGILITSSLPQHRVEGNTIANINYTAGSGSPVIKGISGSKMLVRKNVIHSFTSSSPSISPVCYGVFFNAPSGTFNECSNNMISMGGGNASNPTIYGIYEGSASNSSNLYYYNTVHIYGTASSLNSSYCFYRKNSVNVDLKNNIFSNFRVASPVGQYAIYTVSNTYWNSNFNNLYAASAPLGYWAGNRANLAAWKSATGKDMQSISTAPVFISGTDLHLTAANAGIEGKGTPIPLFNSDIDGEMRNMSAPDPGADEFAAALPKLEAPVSVQENFDMTVYPNPTRAGATIRIVSPEESTAEISLYNILGEKLLQVYTGALPAGIHTFGLPEEIVEVSGTYVCRIVTGNGQSLYKHLHVVK